MFAPRFHVQDTIADDGVAPMAPRPWSRTQATG